MPKKTIFKYQILNPKLFEPLWKAINEMKEIELLSKRTTYPKIIDASLALDELYVYEKLKAYCSELSYRLTFNEESLPHDLKQFRIDDLSNLLRSQRFSGTQIFNQMRIFLEEEMIGQDCSADQLLATIQVIKESKKIIGPEDCLKAFSYMSNISIRQINKNRYQFSKHFIISNSELLNLHTSMKKELSMPSYISSVYKSMISIALNVEEDSFFSSLNTLDLVKHFRNEQPSNRFEWSIQFAKYYKRFLGKNEELYSKYCLGQIYYHQGNLRKAHEKLSDLKNVSTTFMNLSIKVLHLKTLYDSYMQSAGTKRPFNYIGYIEDVKQAYRKVLTNEKKQKKKLSKFHFYYYQTFYDCFFELYEFQGKYDDIFGKKESLIRELVTLKQKFELLEFHFKDWLLLKLEELK